MGLVTILTELKKRRSTFSQAFRDDSSWSLTDRTVAKRKSKKLTIPELVEKTKDDYDKQEQIELDPEVLEPNDEE